MTSFFRGLAIVLLSLLMLGCGLCSATGFGLAFNQLAASGSSALLGLLFFLIPSAVGSAIAVRCFLKIRQLLGGKSKADG